MNEVYIRYRDKIIKKALYIPIPLLLLFLMGFIFSLLTPRYLTVSNFVNIMVQCASGVGIIAIASFSAICIGMVDLSLGAIMSCTGMMAARILTSDASLIKQFGEINPILPVIIAILAAMFLGMALGAFNGLILSKTNIPAFIITVSTFYISETISRLLARGNTIRIPNELFAKIGGGSFLYVLIGRRTIGLIPYSVVILIIIYVFFTVIMRKTGYGTHIYAVGGNQEAALLSGLNVERLIFKVYLINGLIAAIGGIILTSRLTAASAANGLGLEFQGIAAAVVGGASMKGGRSTPLRTLIGALIITAMRNGFNVVGLSNSIQMISIGLVLIIIVGIDAIKSRRQ
jgi:ribose/xylose/arabinose/galactoside ABC-type transport system permease subunit